MIQQPLSTHNILGYKKYVVLFATMQFLIFIW